MEKKKGLSLVGAIVILSISIIIAASILSNAIDNAGHNVSSNLNGYQGNYYSDENYELVVNEGWLYLYETNTGQIWKKRDDAEASWEIVKPYYE